MKRVLVAMTLASFGFATGVNAQTPGPEDLQAIANNLGPTVNALASGLGDTTETLITTQSAVQTSSAVGQTVVDTTGAAIAGAPNLGSLSLLVTGENVAVQDLLNPYLTAIDDPSAMNIQAALAPEDLSTIVENLETTPRTLLEGNGFGANGNGLRSAAINLLQGNLHSGVSENFSRDVVNGTAFTVMGLVDGTNPEPLGLAYALGATGVETVLSPALEQLDGPATQLADQGAPLTDPLVGILEAGF